MTTEISGRGRRRDRWVSWIVIAVTAVALILGWFLKTAAEGRTAVYEAEGLRVRYPADWVRADPRPPLLLQVEDRWATPYRTTLTLARRPVPPGAVKVLPIIEDTLALERGRNWTAYRVLGMEGNIPIDGNSGMRVAFAYVEPNPNPFLETLPVVMHGEDYLFSMGDGVYIATLTAAEPNYAQAQKALKAFLRSLQVRE